MLKKKISNYRVKISFNGLFRMVFREFSNYCLKQALNTLCKEWLNILPMEQFKNRSSYLFNNLNRRILKECTLISTVVSSSFIQTNRKFMRITIKHSAKISHKVKFPNKYKFRARSQRYIRCLFRRFNKNKINTCYRISNAIQTRKKFSLFYKNSTTYCSKLSSSESNFVTSQTSDALICSTIST